MKKIQTKRASHATPAKAAKLETPKGKLAAAPVIERRKEICAERFTLVDSEGNTRASLSTCSGPLANETVLAMYDDRCQPRLTLRTSAKEASLNIFSERATPEEGMDDFVTRIQIGYDWGQFAVVPHIVIFDGDENERVMLPSADFRRAAFGQRVNGAGDPVEDRPASTLSTETTRDTIDEAAIRELVEGFLHRDNDEAAKAFISLIHALAFNADWTARNSIAMYACDAAYQRTLAYSEEAGKFYDDSTAGFSAQVA